MQKFVNLYNPEIKKEFIQNKERTQNPLQTHIKQAYRSNPPPPLKNTPISISTY